MKLLNQNEVEKYDVRGGGNLGGSQVEEIWKGIAQLLIGEGVLIEKEEWPLKSMPYGCNLPKRLKQFMDCKYVTRTLVDESGWIVKRVS